MKLLKNHSVIPPVFITDKPPFVNNKTVFNTSSLLEHIKKQEEFNDLLLQFFNIERPYSRNILEQETNQKNNHDLIPLSSEKINDNQEKSENTSSSNIEHQQDRKVLPELLSKQEEKLPEIKNIQMEEVNKNSDSTLQQLDHQERPKRILLEPIKKHKKKMFEVPDMVKNKKEEIEDSSNSHLDHLEKNGLDLLGTKKKPEEKVTDLMNKEKEEMEDTFISNMDYQHQNKEDLLELIKNLEEKVEDLINNQKEELVDTLMQHLDKQGEIIQSLIDKENKFKYFSLGDHIEVIDGDSKMNGVFIEMSKDGLIWIDQSLSLCLSNIKGIGIRKKSNFET